MRREYKRGRVNCPALPLEKVSTRGFRSHSRQSSQPLLDAESAGNFRGSPASRAVRNEPVVYKLNPV